MKFVRKGALLLVMLLAVSPVSAEAPAVPIKKYVTFTLGGGYTDTKAISPFGVGTAKTLRGLLGKLDRLKTDDEIAGVIFKIEGLSVGWATLQEIRNKLNEFRETEKETIGYLESGGTAEYLLAATMGRVVLMPTGHLNLTGLRAEILFYKGLLDKLDVQAEMLAMGEYKSGVEPYTRAGMSDAFRESMTELLGDLYAQLIGHIAESREGLTTETAAALMDGGPFTAAEAAEATLVDALQYYDELLSTVTADSPDSDVQIAKPDFERKRQIPNLNSLAGLMHLLNVLNPPQRAAVRAPEDRIALIYASGPILPDSELFFPGMPVITPKTLTAALETARTDASVRAVVLRIDSPGGSALASDLIWHEVTRTQSEKPVIVSMGNVAASGGYYIAMGAGTLVAQPSTLTGSIGVFGGKLNLKGLYNKAGITKEIIAYGQNATLYSDYAGFTPTERERVEKLMETVYRDFVSKAAAGRNTSFDALEAVAQGRVWTGQQAKTLGLVDELGGLETALALAKRQAGFAPDTEVNLIILPKQKPFLEELLERMVADMEGSLRLTATPEMLSLFRAEWQHVLTWLGLFGFKDGIQIMTVLPYTVSIR